MAFWKLIAVATLVLTHGFAESSPTDDLDVDEYLNKDDDKRGRLMKDKDPIPASGDLDEDPVVAESVEGENPARIVKNKGPITRKIVASCSPSEGVDFSLVVWKFAGKDGHVHGVMEDSGGSRVGVDCLDERGNLSIVGGIDSSENTRSYVLLDSDGGKVSAVLTGLGEDTSCAMLESNQFGDIYQGRVKICNKRSGEEEWLKCTTELTKSVKSEL